MPTPRLLETLIIISFNNCQRNKLLKRIWSRSSFGIKHGKLNVWGRRLEKRRKRSLCPGAKLVLVTVDNKRLIFLKINFRIFFNSRKHLSMKNSIISEKKGRSWYPGAELVLVTGDNER